MPIAIAPGDPITITATANDTRYSINNGTEPSQNIAEACDSINAPSFVTDTITYPMSASDGSFNSTIENIEATIVLQGWTNGRYTIFVESKDAAGNWGYVSAVFVDVIDPNVAPHITGYVYDATSNDPLQATISTGGYQTTSDPVTGFYEMVVLSGTYDITASAENYVPVTVTGVVAEDNQTVEQDFYLSPLCDAFFDDVEGGNLGWTAQSPWAITDELSNSPSHSWTDSPGGNYGNNKNISLTSQSFDLTDWENLALRFWHTYETQATYDNAIVEYSTDNGSTWTEIVRYSGIMETWTEVELDLTALDGIATAMIRFRLSTNNYLYNDGWHIDDIELFGSSPYCGAPEFPTAEFSSNSPVDLGNPVAFTNESTGTPTLTYLWDFGDGIGTSTEKNPSYTYAAADTYTVTLTATNDYGSDEVTHPVVVQSVPLTGVDLSLAITGTIYVGDVVDFSADLMPDDASKPYTYTIDLGDGSPIMDGTSNLDPLPFTHTYAVTGTFTVLIEAWNEGMGEPVTDSLDINVYDVGVCVPLTGISIEGAAEGTPGVYTFTSTYEPSDASLPVSYLWDNDDETAVSVRTLDVGVHVLTVSAGNCETVEVSGTHTITISEAGESFSTFLPLVTKTGIVQGMTNQIQKGMADDTPAMSFMVLPVLFSAMFSLPVMKKLR